MATENPAVFPEGTPAPRKPNWLLIGGIVAGLVVLCMLFFCFGSPLIVALMGPSIQNTFADVACQTVYTDLGKDKCQAWADDISKNHAKEMSECSGASSSSTPGPDNERIQQFIQCLDDKGIGPKSK